jgi:putative protease
LPPIQLHASTQTDIRTPEKARFLQDVGFSQMVLARELDLKQIAAIRSQVDRATLEFFVHGALCVAYSGQCYVSHAHNGRSANRGDCSQACRLPYTITDAQGRIVAHEKHVLSMKDNNQSANLEALVDAGIRSFKIEGRYKDLGFVKNITAHYRLLLDDLLERRGDLQRGSSGRCSYAFTPDPDRNFNRGATDYFVNGRQDDIGAFDSPKHGGMAIGHVLKVRGDDFDLEVTAASDEPVRLNNGDALTYFDLQDELVGIHLNRVENLGDKRWRVWPKDPTSSFRDLRADVALSRNRDMAWDRLLSGNSAQRRIGVSLFWASTADGFELSIVDDDGFSAVAAAAHPHQLANDVERARSALHEHLGKLGNTIFVATTIVIADGPCHFVPASVVNSLRRDAVAKLEAARAAGYERPRRDLAVEPPVAFPDDTLSYLANVFNHRARDFYARHGVKVIAAAYESHQEHGEVSLMITKHCVRFSLSLCPKQAKGVTGVQGTIKAEPMTIVNGDEKLTLRFDCKPCEMHVVGKIKRKVLNAVPAQTVQFYKARPKAMAGN